jgi:molybdate/tungstate transport system substrate-binding protein
MSPTGVGPSSRILPFRSRLAFLPALLAVSLLLSACADASSQGRSVSVLYAGSLATVMENGVGPAFSKATGYQYKGEAHGSLGAARLIHDRLRRPDVFISADPAVNESVLMGDQNGRLVTWYVVLASSELVLAYNPKSPAAASFAAAAAGKTSWYEALERPGARFGRGDPTIDPKGYRTLFLFTLAGDYYHRPEIPRLLGEPLNPVQVMPETALLARLESGQLDAGIFYRHEIVPRKLPFLRLPPEINLGDPSFAALYARAAYTTPAGERVHGAPILFTVTIPTTVSDRAAAEAFVRFLLTSPELLRSFGFGIVDHQVGGDGSRMPKDLRALCSGTYTP